MGIQMLKRRRADASVATDTGAGGHDGSTPADATRAALTRSYQGGYRSRLSAIFAATMVLTALAVGTAPAANAATNLGGVSVQAACNSFKPGSTARVVAHTAAGWRCQKPWTSDLAVGSYMLSSQCLQQYGPPVRAEYTNFNDPYSWRCYR